MPGTLKVSNANPALVKAIIFIRIIKVDPVTLLLMIFSATIVGVFGAGIISEFSEKKLGLRHWYCTSDCCFFRVGRQYGVDKRGWIKGGGEKGVVKVSVCREENC